MAEAYAYGIICCGVILFQIALIAGAPWGAVTQGGRTKGALPREGRIVAAFSILLLCGMAGAVNAAAGLWPHWPAWTGWLAVAVQAVSFILNWITPSKPERMIWGPITATMLVLAISVVAI